MVYFQCKNTYDINLFLDDQKKILLETDKVRIFFFKFCNPCFGVQAKTPIKIIHFKKKKQSKKQQGKNENITISFHSQKIKIKTHIYINKY